MPQSNIELCWDEFCDWCEDAGVGDPRNGTHFTDWEPWFECWTAAINAKTAATIESEAKP